MKVYATVQSVGIQTFVNGGTVLYGTAIVAFNNSGTMVNTSLGFFVPSGDELTLKASIRGYLADSVSSSYTLTVNPKDVVLL